MEPFTFVFPDGSSADFILKDTQTSPRITDPAFEWKPAVKTNVQDTWKRFGWTPPSERKKA